MFNVDDFVAKFDAYTDEQLVRMHARAGTLTEEAQQAIGIVVQKRGGLEMLLQQSDEKKKIRDEKERIHLEVLKFARKGVDLSFMPNLVTSTILSKEEVDAIIEASCEQATAEINDQKVVPRTIYGSIIGGILASLVGGALWGLQLIYVKKVFLLYFVGLFIVCYIMVNLFTKQSRKNIVVLMATIISAIFAMFIGQFLFSLVGPR